MGAVLETITGQNFRRYTRLVTAGEADILVSALQSTGHPMVHRWDTVSYTVSIIGAEGYAFLSYAVELN